MKRQIIDIFTDPVFWSVVPGVIVLISLSLFLLLSVKRIDAKLESIKSTIYPGETDFDQLTIKVKALERLLTRALISKKLAKSTPVRYLRSFGVFKGYLSSIRTTYEEITETLNRQRCNLHKV